MDPQPIQPPPKPAPILPILIVFIAVLFCATGFLFYQNMQLQKQITVLSITPPPIPSPTLVPVNEGIANWKTYTYPNGMYIFKYPDNYLLGHYSTENSPILLNNKIEWGVTQHPAGGCIGDCPVITKTQNTTLNTYSAILYEGWIGGIGGETPQSYIKYEIKQPSTNNYFVITLWELDHTATVQKNYDPNRKIGSINEEDKKIFDQILSTFKFLDEAQTTYTCPETGWINCMPILTPEAQKACSKEAMSWYKINCPNFQGGAL